MDWVVQALELTAEDRRIAEAIGREQQRLRSFVRKRVANIEDAEDVLQDVFYELVEATRLMTPIEHVSAWLYRVARNRIIDLFRRRRGLVSTDEPVAGAQEEHLRFEDLL